MGLLGGLVGKLVGAAVLLVILVLAFGAFLYATDYPVEATVVDKSCKVNGSSVTVETKVGKIQQVVEDIAFEQCQAVRERSSSHPGSFVEYRIQSSRVTLYEREGGTCIYDSESGAGCGSGGGSGNPNSLPFP